MPANERFCWQKSKDRDWQVVGLITEDVQENVGARKIVGPKMSFEFINVRMTRSNQQIPWGFELQQRTGNEVYVSKLESGSMAEKAGICANDILKEISGQQNLTLKSASDRLRAALEITMILRRPIGSSPSLAWALQRQPDGQFLVQQNANQKAGNPNVDEVERRRFQRHITETRTVADLPSGQPDQNVELPYNTTTHHAEGNSTWNREDDGIHRRYESKRTYTRTESTNLPPDAQQNAQNGAVQQTPTTQSYAGESVLYRHSQEPQRTITTGQTGNTRSSEGFQTQQQPQQQARQQTQTAVQNGNKYTSNTTNQQFGNQQQIQQNQFGTQQQTRSGQNDSHYTMKTTTTYSTYGTQQPGPQNQQSGTQNQQFGSQIQHNVGHNQQFGSQSQEHSRQNEKYTSQSQQHQSTAYPRFPQNQYNRGIPENHYEEHKRIAGVPGGVRSVEATRFAVASQPPANDSNAFTYTSATQHPINLHRREQSAGGVQQSTQRTTNANQQQRQTTAPPMTNSEQMTSIYDATTGGYLQDDFAHSKRSREAHYRNSQPVYEYEQRLIPPLRHRSAYSSPQRAKTSKQPVGPPVYYVPPHPRTYRELSPSASIRHLQFNSPLSLYSPEAAAEAYRQQTGQELHFYPDGPGLQPHRPAYLDSETRRLIIEQERGHFQHSKSPIQSSAMRRIAAGVGVPLE
ncbi:PDZ domain-containing protein [Aphelenchoides besseyi]|nr:PDZ domain-containing protein [Aphelenchoides besseyi]KAI6198638.1 PDZ domain-containing protein [Aphelenchoides besseyi]